MSRKMQGVELSLPVELSFLVLVGFPSGHLHLPSSVIPVLSLSSRSFTVIPVLSLSSPRKRGSMAPHPLSKRARQAVPLRDIRDLAGGVSGQWLSSRAPILPPLRHPRESGDPWSLTRFPKGHVKPCPYGTYETSLLQGDYTPSGSTIRTINFRSSYANFAPVFVIRIPPSVIPNSSSSSSRKRGSMVPHPLAGFPLSWE